MIIDSINIEFITNTVFSSRTYWLTDKNRREVWLVDCGDLNDVFFTPGHDESCLCNEVDENLFTGDAYIPGL